MDNLWSWITDLQSSPTPLPLASSPCGRSILLSADLDADFAVTNFSISLNGFQNNNPSKPLWVSDPIPFTANPNNTHLLFLLQLLHESIALAPSPPHPVLPKPDPAQLLLALGPFPDTPAFLSLALLCRLFWLCAGESPAEAGFLFFRAFDNALDGALDCRRSLSAFLIAAGADREERFMRSVGYMLAKSCILRELPAVPEPRRLPRGCCPSYAAEVHGLLVMKGYAPVPAMTRSVGPNAAVGPPKVVPKEAALRYALAHQQLEFVVQLEYSICGRDPRFLKITLRVDNIRIHMARLVFGRNDDYNPWDVERHFPSRVRVRVGPEVGSSYTFGPSLGRSTENPERVVESTRTLKGGLGVGVRAKARWSARARRRSWRWEQDAEGSAAVFDGVLCDTETGAEVAESDMRMRMMRGRQSGAEPRAFSKGGGLVVSGDELPEEVSWRVGREMEGEKVRWRIGGRVWVSYFPNEMRNGYFETRWVEWEEKVEVSLVVRVGGDC